MRLFDWARALSQRWTRATGERPLLILVVWSVIGALFLALTAVEYARRGQLDFPTFPYGVFAIAYGIYAYRKTLARRAS
jgi:hypothetical protein